jgi:hypothetical protein
LISKGRSILRPLGATPQYVAGEERSVGERKGKIKGKEITNIYRNGLNKTEGEIINGK